MKSKEETRSNQENGILCQNVNTQILFIKFYSSYYSFSLVCICSVEFKLLNIIVCTKLCVQLRARFCNLAQLLSKAFNNNYVHFNERYSSKSLKDTENYH